MLRHFLRKDSGSALVELSLTLPILLFMMIGAAELGRMAYYAIEVQNAARAAVAYGSVAGDTSGMTTAAQNEAPNMNNLTVTATNSCVCETITISTGAVSDGSPQYGDTCAGIGTSTIAANCNTAGAGQFNQVVQYVNATTTATVSTMLHFGYPQWGLVLPSSYILSGHAQMRVLNNL